MTFKVTPKGIAIFLTCVLLLSFDSLELRFGQFGHLDFLKVLDSVNHSFNSIANSWNLPFIEITLIAFEFQDLDVI